MAYTAFHGHHDPHLRLAALLGGRVHDFHLVASRWMHLQRRNGTVYSLLAQFAALAEPGLHALFGGVQSARHSARAAKLSRYERRPLKSS